MTKALRSEADAHIQRIREDKGLDGSQIPQGIVEDLQAATKVLSDQLYAKSTRFILELIQNADDNHYAPGIIPTIEFTYTDGYLRVDCNEAGFTPKNVDAICGIGKSSKAGCAGYVGEKGIGFKSVFRAADAVWVASGDYEFKFDRNSRLGMIAPILSAFPATRRDGWTSFYLQLSMAYDKKQLTAELKSLSANLMMFLQRLRVIRITIEEDRRSGWIQRTAAAPEWHTVLRKTVTSAQDDQVIRLQQDTASYDYIVRHHDVANMPVEDKRLGIRTSRLTIAFPIDQDGKPSCESQSLYAFLPIRDYGFSFLIQGDFLLSASREEIDDLLVWNKALRDNVTNAFIQAVKHFNNGPLRYTWLRYLPGDVKMRDFFRTMRKRLMQRLCDEPVIEAWDGHLARPTALVYVPAKFRDEQGVPLTFSAAHASKYVSGKYEDEDFEYLERLGIQEMNDAQFFADFTHMMHHPSSVFTRKPHEWHERLATVLNMLPAAAKMQLMTLPLIQLQDNTWVTSEKNNVFFPATSKEAGELPAGLDVSVVSSTTLDHGGARAQLYRYLGVRHFDPTAIMDVICAVHSAESNERLLEINREDLVAQLRFLYTHQWRNRTNQQFWVITDQELLLRSEGLYFDSSHAHSAARYFDASDRNRFPFLHPAYSDADEDGTDEKETWTKWLEDNLCMYRVPKLVRPLTTTTTPEEKVMLQSFAMSHDFTHLMRSLPSAELLQLICECFSDYYRQWFDSEAETQQSEPAHVAKTLNESKKRLALCIAEMRVTTREGKMAQLNKTFLPLPELMAEADGFLPFIDVSDPTHSRWKVLRGFGVHQHNDVAFHIACLERIRLSGMQLHRTAYFLEQIQARTNDDEDLVREYFSDNTKERIFVPARRSTKTDCSSSSVTAVDDSSTVEEGSWYKLEHCLWKGPKSLRIHACLADVYPALKRLFNDTLRVCDATMNDLMTEASHFSATDDIAYITDILIQIDKFLERDEVYMLQLESFQREAMWPVTAPKPEKEREKETTGSEFGAFKRLSSSHASDEWFIPDRMFLAECFAPHVSSLALSPDNVAKIGRVIKAFGLERRLLSQAVRSEAETVGLVAFHKSYTWDIQEKYGFIARLIPVSTLDKQKTLHILKTLKNIEVFTAGRVIEKYSLTYKAQQLQGQAGDGNVVIKVGDEKLKIYLREGYLEEERNPDELVDKLALWCGISERREGTYMLQMVLTEYSHEKIAAKFLQHGIPTTVPEMDELMREETWLTAPVVRKRLASKRDAAAAGADADRVLVVTDGEAGDEEHQRFNFDQDVFSGAVETTEETTRKKFRFSAILRRRWLGGKSRSNSDAAGGKSRAGPGTKPADINFVGHKEFSKYLEAEMGSSYQPNKHWTNPLRELAGHAPIADKASENKADFLIPSADAREHLTGLTAPGGFDSTIWAAQPPTWHFIVKTTEGGVDDEFQLSAWEYNLFRKLALPDSRSEKPGTSQTTDVAVLIRVYNTATEARIRAYVNPWWHYSTRKIQLVALGSLSARVSP